MDQGQVLGSYCFPAGFWADSSYMVDAPISLGKNDPNANIEGKVRAFYENMVEHFQMEKTTHAFRPFGCDMAFIEASLNYKIIEGVIKTWNRLGFNETMELVQSTPTRYIKEIANINNNEFNKTNDSWTVRKDDMFPYAQNPEQYWNGFYSTRPHIKKNIRDMTRTMHSSLSLTSQQLLRLDTWNKTQEANDLLMYQFNIMDILGNLVHHDAITGTSTQYVMGDFNDKAKMFKAKVLDMNAKYLTQKLENMYGVNATALRGSLEYWQTLSNLTTPYSHFNELMVVVQNPSSEAREEFIELQLPYYNYTIHEIVNGKEQERKDFDKFLPRTWYNSNKTVVKSYCRLAANFTDARQSAKVFVVRNLGILKQKNLPPANYSGSPERVWNLNLPLFMQKEGWEIDVFQSNFKRGVPPGTTILAGNKTLKFVKLIKKGSLNATRKAENATQSTKEVK